MFRNKGKNVRRRGRHWTVEDIPTGEAFRSYSSISSEAAHVARRYAVGLASYGTDTVPLGSVAAERQPVPRAEAKPSDDVAARNREVRARSRARRAARKAA